MVARALRQTLVALGCCAAGLPATLFAQVAANPNDPADRLFREQTERERARALERAPSTLDTTRPGADPADDEGFPELMQASGPAFAIRHIRADGDAVLDAAQFARITAPFAQRSLTAAHIHVLLERLNRALVRNGTITSNAYVGKQNLAEGTLTISLQAGRIERVLWDGQDLFSATHLPRGLRMALPFAIGDILRLPDIEQALDQYNRVRGTQVQVQIQPGQQPGGSVIDLRSQAVGPRQTTVMLDNQGSASTGKWRTQVTLDYGNVLGLMDTLVMGLTTARDTNALYGTLSLPWGYNTVSLMASASEYQSLIADTALVYGTSNNLSVALNRIIARDQTSKTAVDLSLARRASNRSINNADLSPQVLVVARVGGNRLTRHANGDQWSVDVGWVQGLGLADALRDVADLPAGAARAQFRKAEFSASWAVGLGSASPRSRWVWRTRLNGQWSDDALYSSEQLSAGGVSSVRGFAESALAGDRGVVWRNDWVRDGLWTLWDGKARVDAYAFLDGAHVNTVTDTSGNALWGAGAGLRLNFSWPYGPAVLEAIAGFPVRYPSTLPDVAPRLNLSLQLFF